MDIVSYTTLPIFKKRIHPKEDYFEINEAPLIVAVADGITREKYESNFSGAYEVAKIFCKTSVSYLRNVLENSSKTNIENYLKKAFELANGKIWELNKKYKIPEIIDFLDNDYFGTTAVLGTIVDKKLYLARICDCGAMVIYKGKITFQTPDIWKNLGKYDNRYGEKPDEPKKRRQFIQKFLRNKPELFDKYGRRISYGVLTGEKEALDFIEFYDINLNKEEVVLFYTDGFEPYFQKKEFLQIFQHWKNKNNWVKNELENISIQMAKENEKFDRERTLVAVKI